MKNLIIISPYFSPQNKIGAVRPTKLAKYLQENGDYQITVLTQQPDESLYDPILAKDVQKITNIHYLSRGFISRTAHRFCVFFLEHKKGSSASSTPSLAHLSQPTKKKPLKIWLSRFVNHTLRWLDGRSFYHRAKFVMKENKQDVDLIFSTCGPLSSHWVGRYLKKKNPKAKWIADFRDQVFSEDTPWPYRMYYWRFPQKCCRTADVITCVTEGVLEEINIPDGKRTSILPNGFDMDERVCVKAPSGDCLRMIYTGAMYRGERDFTPLFQVVSELVQDQKIDRSYITFDYAGGENATFLQQAAAFSLEDRVTNHGYISRDKAIQLQSVADILLLASWNRTGSTGIVTGKFLEYLMMKKNIVCCISGDLPDSKLKEMIGAAQVGFCYEEARREENFVGLKEYIYQKYLEKQENGYCTYEPNEQWIQQYDYRYITQKLEELFES